MATFSPKASVGLKKIELLMREEARRRKIVDVILVVITLFQVAQFPSAIMMFSPISIGIVLLGLALCGMAFLYNRLGRITAVGVLLILVIDQGCALMLLTTPMGLDVSNLPTFDLLAVCNLIAVSLLPPWSVFLVAGGNILFIIGDVMFQHHTMELDMVLRSNMAYDAIAQPIALQVLVAVVAYVWVRCAQYAAERANRAEEIAEMQKRDIEQKQQLAQGMDELSMIMMKAAKGERITSSGLNQNNILWRLNSSLNLLLTRLWKASQSEQELQERLRKVEWAEVENQRLRDELTRVQSELSSQERVETSDSQEVKRMREEIARLNEALRVSKTFARRTAGSMH